MHGVEPCLGQTLCALSVPRPASPFGETIFTDSLNLSIFNLKNTNLKTVYESWDAWSRTTLALISYAFCALSVPRPASPFVKATFTGSLNILSNTNMVKVKDEKKSFLPTLGFFVFFYYNKQNYVIIILYPSFLDKQYVVDLPVSGKPHKQAHINVQQHQGCNL